MFRLSKKSDYGLIALRHLAQHADESVSAREIAAQYHIPAELLAKVLQRLARKGLLVSQQGINGGYVLAKDPSTISIVDVVKALIEVRRRKWLSCLFTWTITRRLHSIRACLMP